MKSVVTITVLVALILVSAIFGYLKLFPPTPKAVGIVKTASEGRTIAELGRDYLSQLHQDGRLPGVGTNEHCHTIIGGWLRSYPYLLTMQLTKEGEASTNNYIIMKKDNVSPWQLKRAWQTDSAGKTIKEWPVK
jgi:hypothetical protein